MLTEEIQRILPLPIPLNSSSKPRVHVFPKKIDAVTNTIAALYDKYLPELEILTAQLAVKYKEIGSRGFSANFGDFEGEMLYMLIREYRPELVYEISPNHGYSSNYILAAVTKNGTGRVEGFEIESSFSGVPTPQLILQSLVPLCDQSRYHCNIGDARTTVVERLKTETPNFVMIDSCHEYFFSDFYISKIIPKFKGVMYVQDTAWYDPRPEFASEAFLLLDFLQKYNIEFIPVGTYEEGAASKRRVLKNRKPFRSSSIFFQVDHLNLDGENFGADYENLMIKRSGASEWVKKQSVNDSTTPLTFLQLTTLSGNYSVNDLPKNIISRLADNFQSYDLWCQLLVLQILVKIKRTSLFNTLFRTFTINQTQGLEFPMRLAKMCSVTGNKSEAIQLLQLLRERAKDVSIIVGFRNLLRCSELLAELGKKDEAAECFEQVFDYLAKNHGTASPKESYEIYLTALHQPSFSKILERHSHMLKKDQARRARLFRPKEIIRGLLLKIGFPIISFGVFEG